MEIEVTPKKWYVVSGAAGTTVSKPDGTVVATVPEGGQAAFLATTHTVVTSNAKVEVVEATFNFALALLGMQGGGSSGDEPTEVPSDYITALFLESAEKQYIDTGVSPTENTSILLQAQSASNAYLFANANDNRDEEPDKRFLMTTTQSTAGNGQAYVGFGTLSTNMYFSGEIYTDVNLYGLKNGEVQFGSTTQTFAAVEAFSEAPTVTLFRHRRATTASQIRIWWCKFEEAGVKTREFVPCLDSNGKPCMFDKVTQETYYNANSTSADFTVGMTIAQARQLGKLPADAPSKTLTLYLPKSAFVDVDTGEIADSAVNAALAQAESNDWVITKRYFEE